MITVVCPDCSQELFTGTKKQVEKWLKNNDGTDYAEWDDDTVELMCPQCIWLIDK